VFPASTHPPLLELATDEALEAIDDTVELAELAAGPPPVPRVGTSRLERAPHAMAAIGTKRVKSVAAIRRRSAALRSSFMKPSEAREW